MTDHCINPELASCATCGTITPVNAMLYRQGRPVCQRCARPVAASPWVNLALRGTLKAKVLA